MINSIETKNYHSHKHTKIEFCEGVNIITGASDAGKSDVLRHIKWVVDNRPSGDSVMRWGISPEDAVFVKLVIPEGYIAKKRQQNKVVYELEVKDQKTTFEAVKTDVPSEIQDLINFSEFNYQSQHQSYFLLGDSGGDIAKKLNDLVGLSIIDVMFKNLNSKATESRRKSEEERKRSEELKNEIDKLSYIDDINNILKELKILIDDWEKRTKNNSRLLLLITNIKNICKEISSYSNILGMDSDVRSILNDVEIYETKKTKLQKLSRIISSLKILNDNIEAEKEWLLVERDYIAIKELLGKYNLKKEKYLRLKKVIINCMLISDLSKEKNELNELSFRKRKLLLENKICPFCQTKLTTEVIERILQ